MLLLLLSRFLAHFFRSLTIPSFRTMHFSIQRTIMRQRLKFTGYSDVYVLRIHSFQNENKASLLRQQEHTWCQFCGSRRFRYRLYGCRSMLLQSECTVFHGFWLREDVHRGIRWRRRQTPSSLLALVVWGVQRDVPCLSYALKWLSESSQRFKANRGINHSSPVSTSRSGCMSQCELLEI